MSVDYTAKDGMEEDREEMGFALPGLDEQLEPECRDASLEIPGGWEEAA